LRDGRLVQAGRAEELYRRPTNLFAAGFFAELNVFEADVANGAVETPLGFFAAPGFAEGSAVSVAIRLAGIQARENDGGIPARVVSRRFLGDAELIEVAVAGADMPVRARIKCGSLALNLRDISLVVQESDVLLFERAGESA
ncbi:MAG: ABC transporter ATP-binding protein, partial [Mesorhizobium sp.]|nr:ABC transporter ATP-binding protein [Mesorhizobium sp.]